MSAGTTQQIPNTFCPGKWDELCLNLNYNYAYGCCMAKPMKFVKDFKEVLDPQKHNLLNGIQDESCNHCWQIENSGGTSKRINKYLSKFSTANFDSYIDGSRQIQSLELNLGNECNFQCLYCNPKYSSQWEADVRKEPYKIFTDRFNYEVLDKQEVNLLDSVESTLRQIGQVKEAKIIGGEPLQNKKIWDLIELFDAEVLNITTNLSCKQSTLDKLFSIDKFDSMRFQISLDATKEVSEFVRHGIDYNNTVSNIEHVLRTAPNNVLVTIASTLSSLTVRDLPAFLLQIKEWQQIRPTLIWTLNYCSNPKLQSFSTLPEQYKLSIQESLNSIKQMPNIEFLDTIESALATPYNATMHKELKHFMQQFAKRHNKEIPKCLN